MLKKVAYALTLILIFVSNQLTYSQDFSDISSLNLRELTDPQIDLLLRRAGAQGYNEFDILKIAQSQGFSLDEIEKLDKRFKSAKNINRIAETATTPLEDTRLRKQWLQDIEVFREIDSDVFGYNIFRGTSFLSFQSNLNLPTPPDYILGPGDKLFIDIFGESEAYYQVEISPEGNALLENIGPVNITGLSLDQAKNRLKNRLKSVYNGISNGKTSINISVGIPRAIRINIAGEVQLPGTYNFSAFNTLYNALYVAGGITENASLRDIRLYRNNKLISTVDVYDFLTSGDMTNNVRLENNDLILVGTYKNRVTIKGNVITPGRFESKKGESLKNLIDYAGGFKENAYTKSVKITRIFNDKLKIVDVNSDQFEFFTPVNGDVIEVDQIVMKYENRLLIKGSVYKPGVFSFQDGMTVKDLINKAEGLKPDTYFERAYITRTNPDYSTTTIPFNLTSQVNESENPIALQQDDVVLISSINDLREDQYLEISGEVNMPGIFPYSSNLSLNDLIILAGGLRKSATLKNIEISRLKSTGNNDFDKNAELINVDLNNLKDESIKLKPFDNVIVRKDPSIEQMTYAYIEGEVNYPGKYLISSKKERISDLLKRAGGLKEFAYQKGATIIRKTEFVDDKNDIEKQIDNLNKLKIKLSENTNLLSESEKLLLNRIDQDILKLNNENSSNQIFSSSVKEERITEIVKRNAMSEDIPFAKSESIGINLEDIIKSPGKKSDLLVEEGDIIVIPKKLETVRLRGELLYPTTVRHITSRGLKYYINSAGGFDLKAKRSGTYVVYANGDVARTKKFLFFNFYPKAEPGCEVIVPKKPVKSPLAASQILNFTTGLAALLLAINQIK
ncbi:SLBB domain-containing protein [Flavobacteriales bacterium]|nr:SLBB domain-containing protein [Flavobacteriales bacterium]